MRKKWGVEITDAAAKDLRSIHSYIGRESPTAATRFIHKLHGHITTLERNAARCPRIPENELLGTDYRHLLIGDYRVIFRIGEATVIIMRVIHGARLLGIDMAAGLPPELRT